MIDKSAFRDLSYGLYIVSSMKDGRAVGCVVNTFAQVTSDPPQVSIAINKDNYTTQGILETGKFEVSVVCKEASMELIGMFGFHTSEDTDKFLDFEDKESSQGIPYVAEQICAHFSVKVKEQLDLGTHIFFLGDVVAAEKVEHLEPMTYAYYHEVKGGRTPKNASVFSSDELEADAKAKSEAPALQALVVRRRCAWVGSVRSVDISNMPMNFHRIMCVRSVERQEARSSASRSRSTSSPFDHACSRGEAFRCGRCVSRLKRFFTEPVHTPRWLSYMIG